MVFCHLCLMKQLLITYVVDFWSLTFFFPVILLIQALTQQAFLHIHQHVLTGWMVAFLNIRSVPFPAIFCIKKLKIIQGEVVGFFSFPFLFIFAWLFVSFHYLYCVSSKKTNINLNQTRWKSAALGLQDWNAITESKTMKVVYCKVSNYLENFVRRCLPKILVCYKGKH